MSITGPRSISKFLFGIALLVAIFVAPARSQNYVKGGTFTLPFEARWGQVMLPAGTYSFLLAGGYNSQIIIQQGTRYRGIVPVFDFSGRDAKKLEHGSLLCVRHNATYSVRALNLPEKGTFYFPVSKDKNQTVAQAPELIQSVPVVVAGS